MYYFLLFSPAWFAALAVAILARVYMHIAGKRLTTEQREKVQKDEIPVHIRVSYLLWGAGLLLVFLGLSTKLHSIFPHVWWISQVTLLGCLTT